MRIPFYRRCPRIAAALLLAAMAAGCAERGSPLRIEISHVVGSEPLRLDSDYGTQAGDTFSLSRLRYYLSNVRLHRRDGSWYAAPADARNSQGYYLIDETVAASKAFEVPGVPAGEYDGLEFLLGVDAARNGAGAQTGTLDPTHGMFWTWKSGYIFLLLEGRSPQAGNAAQALSYHVGGAGEPAASRTVYLSLAPKPAKVETRVLPTVHLHADIAQLWRAPHPIRFADFSEAMGGEGAQHIADNAAGMFSVDHVHHEPRRAAP